MILESLDVLGEGLKGGMSWHQSLVAVGLIDHGFNQGVGFLSKGSAGVPRPGQGLRDRLWDSLAMPIGHEDNFF